VAGQNIIIHAETAKFLQQIDPSLPPLQPQSVRATRDMMLKFQGFNLCTLAVVHGGDQTSRAELEEKRLDACAQQAIGVISGAVLSAVPTDAAKEPAADEPAAEESPAAGDAGASPGR
jgi:hypothetical protein